MATSGSLCLTHTSLETAKSYLDYQAEQRQLDLRGIPVTPEIFEHVTALVVQQRGSGNPLNIWFTAAEIPFGADFFGWEFSGSADFQATQFRQEANFGGSVFRRSAWFDGAWFAEDASYENAIFLSDTGFGDSCFSRDANFYKARFESATNFSGACFYGDLSLTESKFEGNQWLGPIACLSEVSFDRASFEGSLTLELSGGFVDFSHVRFSDTLTIRSRWSALSLETVVLTRPALIASSPPFEGLDDKAETSIEQLALTRPGKASALPRIESMRYANVEALTLAHVDMRACQLASVRNLDRVRLEGDVYFASAPRLRARRRVIAEEQYWRSRQSRRRGWKSSECEIVSPFVKEEEIQPRQLASIYRALRKSLEDSKDSPGAADFYYGEMEMRRLSRATPTFERMLIYIYWGLSGYGLRASRSLLALLAVLGAFGWLYSISGFETDQSLLTGVLTSARAAFLIPYSDGPATSQVGQAFQIALRILGPLLLGLALLSIRARIKR